jgi:hypothetical protein
MMHEHDLLYPANTPMSLITYKGVEYVQHHITDECPYTDEELTEMAEKASFENIFSLTHTYPM